jgi:hypothetical protein
MHQHQSGPVALDPDLETHPIVGRDPHARPQLQRVGVGTIVSDPGTRRPTGTATDP